MKHLKRNAIILFVATVIVLYVVLKDDFPSILQALSTANLWWIVVAILCYFLYLLLKSVVLYQNVKQELPHYRFYDSLRHNVITQFFNGVTPFSTGGQPMEVYMLNKKGMKVSRATNLILQTFLYYQVALVLFGFLAVVVNLKLNLFASVSILNHFIFLGFLINTIVVIVTFVVAFFPKVDGFILRNLLTFLNKIHLIKDLPAAREKWQEHLSEFSSCANNIRQNKKMFVEGVVIHFISLACLYIIPIFLAFSMREYHSINVINTLIASAYTMVIGSFVPIPGASLGIEFGFMNLFGVFFKGSILPALLLIWRFITYYLGVILGGILFCFDKGAMEKCE